MPYCITNEKVIAAGIRRKVVPATISRFVSQEILPRSNYDGVDARNTSMPPSK